MLPEMIAVYATMRVAREGLLHLPFCAGTEGVEFLVEYPAQKAYFLEVRIQFGVLCLVRPTTAELVSHAQTGP